MKDYEAFFPQQAEEKPKQDAAPERAVLLWLFLFLLIGKGEKDHSLLPLLFLFAIMGEDENL